MKRLYILLGFIFLLSFSTKAQEQSEDFFQLIDWLSGEYNAYATAQNGSAEANLTLHIAPIWPNATTGAWVYVEESKEDSLDSPFRQQVYFLSEISDGEFSMDVYMIPGDSAFIGAWKNPSAFDGMTAFDLKHQNGCALFLNYDGFQYSGKTNSGTCKSQTDGSDYTTSDIILLPTEYQVWYRLFDESGKQISGSTKEAIKYLKN